MQISKAGPCCGTWGWPTMRMRYRVCVSNHKQNRTKNVGNRRTTNPVPTRVPKPNTNSTRSADMPSRVWQVHKTPEARRTPKVLIKLMVAIRRPFSPLPLRCCTKALRGTMSNPPARPRVMRSPAAMLKCGGSRAKAKALKPMPSAPRGTSPSSTLLPESRPAAKLPTPIPTAINVCNRPTCTSVAPNTSLP